jgi:hypothetical protein
MNKKISFNEGFKNFLYESNKLTDADQLAYITGVLAKRHQDAPSQYALWAEEFESSDIELNRYIFNKNTGECLVKESVYSKIIKNRKTMTKENMNQKREAIIRLIESPEVDPYCLEVYNLEGNLESTYYNSKMDFLDKIKAGAFGSINTLVKVPYYELVGKALHGPELNGFFEECYDYDAIGNLPLWEAAGFDLEFWKNEVIQRYGNPIYKEIYNGTVIFDTSIFEKLKDNKKFSCYWLVTLDIELEIPALMTETELDTFNNTVDAI